MEVMASRFLYAAAILCTLLCIILFHQGSATTIVRTLPGNCAGDIPGEPSAVSGWLGREIATQHREYNRKRSLKPTEKGIGRHHHGRIAPWMGRRFHPRLCLR
ncbi:putative target of rapamycin (TOR) kinase 1 [Trypanosoma cruzi]|nr:putative target of rapamycin (TOR) kinase 1 [Trypanosoma cruzi]RNC37993.1 putative target of rapamycin (TOR) kinase 1 [Trypanosoma cruzi]